MDATLRAVLPLGPGSVVAQAYELQRKIGQGAMGTVYEALVRSTGERVAVKIPHDCFRLDDSALKRFLQEARATLMIRSPYVVRTMAVGRLPSGMPFFAMEYVDGVNLRDIIHAPGEQRPGTGKALMLVEQMALGLTSAHQAGVIHRDLKPSNVLVASYDTRPCARIFDFGLSLLADEASARLTLSGSSFGTPEYMAPEQISDARSVDALADLYSLAVIAYELLSGTLPFGTGSPREIWQRVTHDEPVALSSYRPDLASGICDEVMKALARDPEARHGSVEEFRLAIALQSAIARGVVTRNPGRAPVQS
jgi:eukaryotic-like serine/threonine-protein kinase